MKSPQPRLRFLRRVKLFALAALFLCAMSPPLAAQAKEVPADALPTLEQFVEQVANGNGETLRGVYVPLKLALPVVQQPPGREDYVSPMNAEVTEFRMAQKAGSVGLLAHNYLAGRHFFNIERGDLVFLAYGNRRVETFVVEEIRKYEELYNGLYKDLETLQDYDARQVFHEMYGGERHVTLQTCIEKDGNWNWGRLFIIALPQVETEALAPPPPPPPPPPVVYKPVLGWPLLQRAEKIYQPAFPLRIPRAAR